MDQEALCRFVRRKLQDGRLPHDSSETCDACDTVLAPEQLLMEGITLDVGRRPFRMHVRCFQVWEHERRAT